jgi:Protein of unknown function (DUF3185)
MQRIIGVICLVLGVMLLVWGHDSAQSINSQANRILTGNPSDRTMYFYAGGAALTLYGLLQIVWKHK